MLADHMACTMILLHSRNHPYTLHLLRFLVEFTEHIGLSEDSLLCIVVRFAVSSSMSLSRNFRRLICVPVDFIKITLAFMAAMSRMFPHTISGHLREADLVEYRRAI